MLMQVLEVHYSRYSKPHIYSAKMHHKFNPVVKIVKI